MSGGSNGGAADGRAWLKAQAARSRAATGPLILLGLLSTALAVLQAFCLARLVGPALVGHAVSDPAFWAAVFAAAALLRAGLAVLVERRGFEAGVSARRRLRTAFLVESFAAGPHRIAAAGEAVSIAVDQVESLDGLFSRWLPASTLAWAAPLLVLAVVLAVDPLAGAVMAAGGLLVPVGMALAGLGAAAASQRQFEAMARLQTRFLDRVRGIATIVLAGQAGAEAERLRDAADDLSRRTMRVLRVAFLSSSMLDAAAVGVLVVLALRAGAAWRGGTLHPIAAVFTLVVVSEFFAPLRAFSAAYQDRVQAATAAAALGPVPAAAAAAAAAPVSGRAAALASPAIRTVTASGVTVAFDKVRFTWDPARGPALDDLSFRVPAGEAAVLVGPSGSGKSTVLELLLGFIRPDSGRVTVNGADLATLTPGALSSLTAWIGQRPVLFAGSIRDNIRFGRPDAPEAAVEDAVRAAGLGAVADSLPQGLDTPIGEGGFGLSGGQAQRVAIARAFIRNAPLLLLDEPTAHLDPVTEADVLDSLRRLALGRTVVMTAHSGAAMAFGGRRITLDHGRSVAAQGAA
jgi:ATP-binding cassette subfamily C protein CydD